MPVHVPGDDHGRISRVRTDLEAAPERYVLAAGILSSILHPRRSCLLLGRQPMSGRATTRHTSRFSCSRVDLNARKSSAGPPDGWWWGSSAERTGPGRRPRSSTVSRSHRCSSAPTRRTHPIRAGAASAQIIEEPKNRRSVRGARAGNGILLGVGSLVGPAAAGSEEKKRSRLRFLDGDGWAG